MRTRQTIYNILFSFLLQLTTIIIGLILPKLIIDNFGSSVNGLIASITQFLGLITILEAGVGPVIVSALYKPLAEKDNGGLNRILRATEKNFRKIASIFLGYVVLLMIFFPISFNHEYSWLYTVSLILIIASSTFAQYYFGISYALLLQADQKSYIINIVQIFTLIMNFILSVFLILLGANIHFVRLLSSIIFVARPIFLYFYTKKHYSIDNNVDPDNEALKQRWDAMGQHMAFLLRSNTDVILLTVFMGLKHVSVYSVYQMVIMGLRNITTISSTGVGAAFGNMIALKENQLLEKNFKVYELVSNTIMIICFTTGALTILPFIAIYTRGFSDINYIEPYFAYAMILAGALYCLRLPYSTIVSASGHFKQTNKGAYIEAFLKLIISIIFVNVLGLFGLALGTIISNLYRTLDLAIYSSRNILNREMRYFLKRQVISIINVSLIIAVTSLFPSPMITTYIDWIFYSSFIFIISSFMTIIFSIIFYYKETSIIMEKFNLKIKFK